MAIPNEVLPPDTDLIRVEVTWLDGTTEGFEASACQLSFPGVLLLMTPKDGDYGISLTAIKRRHARHSGLRVVRGH